MKNKRASAYPPAECGKKHGPDNIVGVNDTNAVTLFWPVAHVCVFFLLINQRFIIENSKQTIWQTERLNMYDYRTVIYDIHQNARYVLISGHLYCNTYCSGARVFVAVVFGDDVIVVVMDNNDIIVCFPL